MFLQEYGNDIFYLDGFEEILTRCDLHYQDMKSDKVYIIVLCRESNKFYLRFYYGRRGSSLQHTERIYNDIHSATDELRRVKKEKMNKGYAFVHQADMPATAYRSSTSMPSVQVMNFNKARINGEVHDDFYVLEHIPVENYRFVQVNHQQWEVFYTNQRYSHAIPIQRYMDIGAMNQFNGYVFFGVQYNDRIQVIDFPHASNGTGINAIYDINEKTWKQRRVMMTQVFSEIYPDDDPFNKSLPVFLNDYEYEDKSNWFKKITDGFVIARHIDGIYGSSMNVLQEI